MKKRRKHYTPEEKVAILRRHLVEGVPISDLCDESGLQPTVFYRWQKEFFENGAAAFQQRGRTNHQPEQERIAYLEKKVQTNAGAGGDHRRARRAAGDSLGQRAGVHLAAFSGLVLGKENRGGAHRAREAGAERACREFSRQIAGRVLERELVSESVGRATENRRVAEGVQRRAAP